MTPVRTCVGCRQRRASSELVRLGLDATGRPRVSRTMVGRGAWLCPSQACVERAVATKALPRAFRRPLQLEGHALVTALLADLDAEREPVR